MAAKLRAVEEFSYGNNNRRDHAFDLIRAVPFTWDRSRGEIYCDHPGQLAGLLNAPANTQPIPARNISALLLKP